MRIFPIAGVLGGALLAATLLVACGGASVVAPIIPQTGTALGAGTTVGGTTPMNGGLPVISAPTPVAVASPIIAPTPNISPSPISGLPGPSATP